MRRERRRIATERDCKHEFNNNRTSDGDAEQQQREAL